MSNALIVLLALTFAALALVGMGVLVKDDRARGDLFGLGFLTGIAAAVFALIATTPHP